MSATCFGTRTKRSVEGFPARDRARERARERDLERVLGDAAAAVLAAAVVELAGALMVYSCITLGEEAKVDDSV